MLESKLSRQKFMEHILTTRDSGADDYQISLFTILQLLPFQCMLPNAAEASKEGSFVNWIYEVISSATWTSNPFISRT